MITDDCKYFFIMTYLEDNNSRAGSPEDQEIKKRTRQTLELIDGTKGEIDDQINKLDRDLDKVLEKNERDF